MNKFLILTDTRQQKVEYGINISLHNAINQQINELGWK